MLIAGPQRHDDARRAKAALRTMAVHHGLLHGVQRLRDRLARTGGLACTLDMTLVLEVFYREQGLAMQAGQKLNAGVDGLQLQAIDGLRITGLGQLADDHRAGAAIAFVATFLGARAVRILTQPLQHRAGGVRALHFDHLAAVVEAYGLRVVTGALDRGTELGGLPVCKIHTKRSLHRETTRALAASHIAALIRAMQHAIYLRPKSRENPQKKHLSSGKYRREALLRVPVLIASSACESSISAANFPETHIQQPLLAINFQASPPSGAGRTGSSLSS